MMAEKSQGYFQNSRAITIVGHVCNVTGVFHANHLICHRTSVVAQGFARAVLQAWEACHVANVTYEIRKLHRSDWFIYAQLYE